MSSTKLNNQQNGINEGISDVIKGINYSELSETIAKHVPANGWKKSSVGKSSYIDYDDKFDLYIRRRRLSELIAKKDEISKTSSKNTENDNTDKPCKSKDSNTINQEVSKVPFTGHNNDTTPSVIQSVINGNERLPVLSDFSQYESLMATRTNRPALVIGFDSEWYYIMINGHKFRRVLTWQFSLIDGEELVEYVFFRKNEKDGLSLELALGRILDSLAIKSTDIRKVRRYEAITGKNKVLGGFVHELFDTKEEALKNSKYHYMNGQKIKTRNDWSKTQHIPVVLLCHFGRVDVSTFDQKGKYSKQILRCCSEVQGGLITLQPTKTYVQSVKSKYARSRNTHKYPISLQFADTMCHAPDSKKKLEDLGKVIKWEKIELADGVIEHMNILLRDDPCAYFEYASNDSIVTLLYESALYGYNMKPPVTVTSAAANVMKKTMMGYLGCSNIKEFERKYRGLEKVSHGLVPRDDRPGYLESTSMEPISDKANTIQHYASHAYHGGYNTSCEIGYYPGLTFDYDLKNAYPTAMCLVPDVDWEDPIREEINDRYLTLEDFKSPNGGGYNPITLMFAYVSFVFPSKIKYPCTTVIVDSIPIYPRTSDGIDGIYACGPELYLALQLGAKIYVERGFILNTCIVPKTGKTSYALRTAVKQLVADRDKAKAKRQNNVKTLEELILKTMVCAGYGKMAQDVINKTTWSAYRDEMVNMGCSAITNPVSACMTTSIVRAVLIAVQNQCNELGYITHSVTTDGFISNITFDKLKILDLYGFKPYMEQARLFLTDGKDAGIWEIKHVQDDLVNFITRGNVSLRCVTNPIEYNGIEYEGVCAHNSCKSGYPSDSYEDRRWLMTEVVKRIGTVDFDEERMSTFKELARGEEFEVKTIPIHRHMDFDMKRKPDRTSFKNNSVPIDGNVYEIANFSTVPFESVAEYREYRKRKESVKCLRTMEEWERFWFKTDTKGSNIKVKDMDWTILRECIVGHRAGEWVIPKLNELKGKERDAWINSHNVSNIKWDADKWKNAGRDARQGSSFPHKMLEDKLEELINDI